MCNLWVYIFSCINRHILNTVTPSLSIPSQAKMFRALIVFALVVSKPNLFAK